jgi:hypothetical protein
MVSKSKVLEKVIEYCIAERANAHNAQQAIVWSTLGNVLDLIEQELNKQEGK